MSSNTTLLSTFPAGPTYNVTPYTVDWVGLGSLPSILDTTVYQTDMEHYDALGRPSKTTLPADVNTNRKEIKTEYNKAGALKKVHYDGTEYIREMAWNAKGQPLLQVLGNGVMTRYTYSDTNFKLLRTQSEEYTYTKTGNEHKYAYDTGTKKHNTAHLTDLAGNILKMLERSTDCGLSGTPDQLDRKFKYSLSRAAGIRSTVYWKLRGVKLQLAAIWIYGAPSHKLDRVETPPLLPCRLIRVSTLTIRWETLPN